MTPSPAEESGKKRLTRLDLLRELYHYTAPKGDNQIRLRIGLAVLALFLAKGANVITPLAYGAAVDLVNGADGFSMTTLWWVLGGYALARLSQQIFAEAKEYFFARVAFRAVRGAALAAFRHLHNLSLKFHLERQTGGMSRAIERGAKAVEYLLTAAVIEVLPLFVEVLFVSGLLWVLFGFEFAIITFVTVVLYAFFTMRVTEWRMRFRRQMNAADETAATRAVDSLLNYETVKYFNAEQLEAARYDTALRDFEQAAVRSRTSLAAVNIGQGAIIAGGLMLVMGLAGREIAAGQMSIGDFVVVNTYLLQLYLPLNYLGWVYREMRQSLVDLERMFGLLEENPSVQDIENAPELRLQGGAIRFESVSFSYGPRQILQDVSFAVEAGKQVAIVGPSGAGKSTLSRLLFRFYDPDAGRILIDGQDIRQITQNSLRAAIGVVPQDTVMFNASIGFNIGYGLDGARQADIERAASLAAIDSFINRLPEGYDTLVGERGLKLSGGEKQRVAIARAILKAPSIFLFDEATSALDSRTEKAIQQALQDVSHQRTTLIIAHRLSTIIDADEILVMNEGRIAERGTHAELLDQKGLYAAMWARQSQGFVDGEGEESGGPDGSSQDSLAQMASPPQEVAK